MPTFPEIPESEARSEVAALYDDLRQVTGIPLVNLIWRHFAVLPGMLPWAWQIVRPLHVSGVLPAARATLLEDVRVPPDLAQPRFVFSAAGVSDADLQVIAVIIAEYERGNAANLLSLLGVRAILRGQSAGGGAPPEMPRLPATPSAPLPPLPALGALAPDTQALVLALDQFGRRGASSAVASLYRHLALWPGFLAIAHATLLPHQRAGMLRTAHEALFVRARDITTRQLLPVMACPEAPDPVGALAAVAALDQFTTHMIARMVVMGRALQAMLPA